MSRNLRLANQAWEALFRAQMTIARELKASHIWDELLENEYSVLHTLSGAPDGMRMSELTADVLITRAGLSRLIARMEERGLIARDDDPEDGRAYRLRLTEEGAAKQHRIGMA
ncbi:MAG: MarR family transcriptional regulator, partial [Propionicimonas sp.]|nr:MarR family transcriptional regulator [Propionicimonas sp.]